MPNPPKPTAIKLLEGNRGKRSLPKAEPKPAAEIPPCPAWLPAEAKAEWKRITTQLHKLGLVSQMDTAMLATYCKAWADFRAATEDIERRGYVIQGTMGERKNPYLTVQRLAIETLLSCANHFGMSPMTRTRIAVPTKEQGNPLEEFLKLGAKKA